MKMSDQLCQHHSAFSPSLSQGARWRSRTHLAGVEKKTINVKLQTYLASYEALLGWLFDKGDFKVVSTCAGQWSKCIPQLQRLTKASDCGETLFGFVWELLNEEALAECLALRFKEFSFQSVSADDWAKLQQCLMSDMEAFKESKSLFGKRSITIEFRGCKLDFVVHSPTSEMNLRLLGAVKEKVIGALGGVAPLLHECWIPFQGAYDECKWHSGLLDDVVKARNLAKDILQPSLISCAQDVATLLTSSRDLLTSVDHSFNLELAWAEKALPNLLPGAVHGAIFESLPSRAVALSFQASLDGLKELQGSMRARCADRATQDELEATIEAVTALTRHQPPKAVAGSTPFMSRMLARLQFYVRYSPSTPSSAAAQAPQELVGKAALRAKLGDLRAAIAADAKSLNLSRLDVFQAFRHLMEEDEKKEVDAWVATVLDRAVAGNVTGVAGRHKREKQSKSAANSLQRFF